MARVIDTSGLPSVMPAINPPDDYQRINASPEAFGSQIGAAQQRVGAQMEQGSNELASAAIEKQGIYNNTAANQLFTKFQNSVNNLMSGDPEKPGDLGYFGLTGQAAMEQRQPVRKQMDDMIAQGMASAPNDVVRNRFQEISRRLQSITYEQMGQHYEREMKTWGISTAMGAITETQRGIANNYNNDEYFKHSLADSDTMSAEQAKTSGVNPATLIAENQSKAVEARIKGAIGQNDYAWAQNIFQQYGDKLDPNTRAVLQTHLKGKADAAAGQQMFNQWQTGSAPSGGGAPGGSGAPRASAGGVDPGTFHSYLTNDLKATPNEAALLTSAVSSESNFNPNATHDGGIGFGLFGHNGDRLAAMQQQAGTDKPGWQAQAKFALNELRSRPEGALVNSATTPEQLTDLQMQFEQPKRTPETQDGNYAGRLATTRQIMASPPKARGGGAQAGGAVPNPNVGPDSANGIIDKTADAGFGDKFGHLDSVKGMIIHHTAGGESVDGVIGTFKQTNFPAQFVIDRQGQIYRTLPEGAQG